MEEETKGTIITIALIISMIMILIGLFSKESKGIEPEKIKQSVRNATEYIQENRKENLKIFDKKNNKFTTNENYIYLINYKTLKMIEHPVKPKLEGRDMSNMQDKNGNYFILQMIAKSAQYKDKGYWIKYWWPKPNKEKASKKFAFCKRVVDENILVVSGIYSEKLKIEKLNFYIRNSK